MTSKRDFFTCNDRHESGYIRHLVQGDRLLWIREGRARSGCAISDLDHVRVI